MRETERETRVKENDKEREGGRDKRVKKTRWDELEKKGGSGNPDEKRHSMRSQSTT